MRLLTTLGIVLIANLLAALPAAAEFRAGFGSRVVTPQNFESWTDADGDAQYSPDIDTFNDANGNGVFDAPGWPDSRMGAPRIMSMMI